jgi:hypothetical protein
MKVQRPKIIERRRGPKNLAVERQRALARDPEIEETVAKIVGTTAAPRFTTAPVALDSTTGVLPEFGRWQDVQRWFGIKRGTLYNLVADGKVKAIPLRRKGNKHGCTLFYLPGISAYLHSLLQAQTKDGA